MRILQLVSEKSWRGGEQQVAYLLEELKRLGITCHVCCRKGSKFEAYCKQHEFPHIALPFTKVFPIPTALALKQYINKHQIQLVHMQASHAHTIGVLAHMLGANCELVLSRRVEFERASNFLSAIKYNYKGIKKIICISERVREVLAQSIKDGSKCVTVYSGIDLSRFSQTVNVDSNFLRRTYNIAPDNLLIGNISAFDVHKDYFTFLDTASILKKQGIKATYLAIGTGKLEEEIKQYAASLGLQHDVIFTGFIKNVHQVLPELDFFVFTTIKEGLGSTVLDAFASKVPVIASAVGGIPEMVEDGITGMMASPKQPAIFAEKVIQLIQSPALREQVVENAARKVLTFSKEETALQTLAVYTQILDAH